jgi:hypothetical protein
MIPVCAWWGNLRDDKGFWQRVVAYLANHPRLSLSHGICPDWFNRSTAENGTPHRPS